METTVKKTPFCDCEAVTAHQQDKNLAKGLAPTTSSDNWTCDHCGYYVVWSRGDRAFDIRHHERVGTRPATYIAPYHHKDERAARSDGGKGQVRGVIICTTPTGETQVYPSMIKAAKELKISAEKILLCIRNNVTYKGFRFKREPIGSKN